MRVYAKIIIIIFLFVLYTVCNNVCSKKPPTKAEDPVLEADTLWVEVHGNVLGYPESGMSVYQTPDTIDYLYSPKMGNTHFMVTLDGVQVPDSGSFIMDQNHHLKATCEDKVIWKLPLKKHVYYSSPAVADDGTIYISTGIYRHTDWGSLYAVNPDGTIQWSYDCEYNPYTPVIGDDGTVYIQDFHNTVYAIGSGGSLKWKFKDFNNPIHIWYDMGQRIPAIGSDGTVYIGAERGSAGFVYCFNSSGIKQWKYVVEGAWRTVRASPVIGSDGTIYIATKSGGVDLPAKIIALSPGGSKIWEYIVENFHGPGSADDVYSTPSVGADGTLYFGSENEHFYALNADGSLKWKTQLEHGTNWSSPAICIDGTLYIGTHHENPPNRGNLYAIQTKSMGYASSPWPRFRQNHMNDGRYKH